MSEFSPKNGPGQTRPQIMANGRYRFMVHRIVVVIIVVSFIPMSLAAGIILMRFNATYTVKVRAHLGELVLKHRQQIDAFLSEKLGNIRFLTRCFGYSQLADEAFLKEQLERLKLEYGSIFEDLGVVNQAGLQVAYAGPFKLDNVWYTEAEWFKAATHNQYFISDVFLGLRGLPHFIVAVRVDSAGGFYIVRATINFMAFNSLVENLQVGHTGFAFILNRKGEFQTTPRFTITDIRQICEDFAAMSPSQRVKINISEVTDENRLRYLLVAAALKSGDWIMVFQQQSRDAFADLKHTQLLTVAVSFLGGVGIVTMAYLTSGRIVRPLLRVEAEKEMMNQQVIETGKLATIGELAAGIAHEINNPVAIMVEEAGWLQDLLEEASPPDPAVDKAEFTRSLEQIRTQGRRCKDITHKLLSFARKTDARIEEIDINDLVREVADLLTPRARYANTMLSCELALGLPLLKISPSEMQQVLMNIVNNALDALESCGGQIRITTALNEEGVEIGISDNGPGIPQAILERIFDPFFTTKPVGKGTGLGLSICFGIIRKLGGDITVQSSIGQGTSFLIRVPVHGSTTTES